MTTIADIAPLLLGAAIHGNVGTPVSRLRFSSAEIASGDTFVAIRGFRVDGHRFVAQAIANGATSVICEEIEGLPEGGVAYIVVEDSAAAMGIVAHALNGDPSESLVVVGITGTNGKTTTATTLYRLYSNLGFRCGLLSTIRNVIGDETIPSTHTTGDSLQIAGLMARMVERGCTHCFMEVTSHAVAQRRIAGIQFNAGVFTNFSQDHLDFHGTMEAYFEAKKSFFDSLSDNAVAIVNIDDEKGREIASGARARVKSVGRNPEADYILENVRSTSSGLIFTINGLVLRTPMVGDFNAANLAGVFAVACELGIGRETIATGLASIPAVEGRMQAVAANGLRGIVDFAHTPDALQTVLRTLRDAEGVRKVILVFGCGGDRDREKRPLMGRIAVMLADEVIVTSDNPRSEDPRRIIEEIVASIDKAALAKIQIEPDRSAAIARACQLADEHSVVLVAGKGHERFQEIAGEKRPFDDAAELLEQLRRAHAGQAPPKSPPGI